MIMITDHLYPLIMIKMSYYILFVNYAYSPSMANQSPLIVMVVVVVVIAVRIMMVIAEFLSRLVHTHCPLWHIHLGSIVIGCLNGRVLIFRVINADTCEPRLANIAIVTTPRTI